MKPVMALDIVLEAGNLLGGQKCLTLTLCCHCAWYVIFAEASRSIETTKAADTTNSTHFCLFLALVFHYYDKYFVKYFYFILSEITSLV